MNVGRVMSLCVHSTLFMNIVIPKHFKCAPQLQIQGSFHSVFCLTTGSKPPPKRFLHIVRSRASSFKYFRRQFLRKMWPIQLAFRFLISCRIFLCALTLNNTFSFLTWLVQMTFSILLQHHISKLSRYFWSAARSIQVSAPYKAKLQM
jgi:hypothetical protein